MECYIYADPHALLVIFQLIHRKDMHLSYLKLFMPCPAAYTLTPEMLINPEVKIFRFNVPLN